MGEKPWGHHIFFSRSFGETHKSVFTLSQKVKKVEFFFVRAKNLRLCYAGGLRRFLRLDWFWEQVLAEVDHEAFGLCHLRLGAGEQVVVQRRLDVENEGNDGSLAVGAQTDGLKGGFKSQTGEQFRSRFLEREKFVAAEGVFDSDLFVPHVVFEGGLVGFLIGRIEGFGELGLRHFFDFHGVTVFFVLLLKGCGPLWHPAALYNIVRMEAFFNQ